MNPLSGWTVSGSCGPIWSYPNHGVALTLFLTWLQEDNVTPLHQPAGDTPNTTSREERRLQRHWRRKSREHFSLQSKMGNPSPTAMAQGAGRRSGQHRVKGGFGISVTGREHYGRPPLLILPSFMAQSKVRWSHLPMQVFQYIDQDSLCQPCSPAVSPGAFASFPVDHCRIES